MQGLQLGLKSLYLCLISRSPRLPDLLMERLLLGSALLGLLLQRLLLFGDLLFIRI